MRILWVVGDHLTAVWGPVVLAQRSGLLAAGGLGIALLIAHPVVAIVGYALFGVGLSCIFPIVLRAAGHLEHIQAAAAIAAVSTIGYTGFLAGPPMIGLLAEGLTLRGALGVVVMLTFLIAFVAGSMQQQNSLSPLTGSGTALFLHSSTLERGDPQILYHAASEFAHFDGPRVSSSIGQGAPHGQLGSI